MSKLKIRDQNDPNTWYEIPAGGVGVPSGGTAGQILMKSSSTDYADEWADISEAGAMSEWTLLWTNASPTSAFAAQTISIDLSGYDMIAVKYGGNGYQNETAGNDVRLAFVPSTESVWLQSIARSMIYGTRAIQVSATGVVVEKGSYVNTSSATDNNYCAVPKAIYGIKGVQTA